MTTVESFDLGMNADCTNVNGCRVFLSSVRGAKENDQFYNLCDFLSLVPCDPNSYYQNSPFISMELHVRNRNSTAQVLPAKFRQCTRYLSSVA